MSYRTSTGTISTQFVCLKKLSGIYWEKINLGYKWLMWTIFKIHTINRLFLSSNQWQALCTSGVIGSYFLFFVISKLLLVIINTIESQSFFRSQIYLAEYVFFNVLHRTLGHFYTIPWSDHYHFVLSTDN